MIEKLICKLCGKEFVHLGSHIWHKHKMLARHYKSKFGLPYKLGLVSEQVMQKQRKANLKHKEQNKKNLTMSGKKYRFRKGHTGQRRISEYERRRILKRILDVNKSYAKLEQCPVCKMKYKHLASHMYQVHCLISVKGLHLKGAYTLKE